MLKFEYTSVVLHLVEKNFSLTSKDILQGISAESKNAIRELGDAGWDLVSVVPYSSGFGDTNSILSFFKRAKE